MIRLAKRQLISGTAAGTLLPHAFELAPARSALFVYAA